MMPQAAAHRDAVGAADFALRWILVSAVGFQEGGSRISRGDGAWTIES